MGVVGGLSDGSQRGGGGDAAAKGTSEKPHGRVHGFV